MAAKRVFSCSQAPFFAIFKDLPVRSLALFQMGGRAHLQIITPVTESPQSVD